VPVRLGKRPSNGLVHDDLDDPGHHHNDPADHDDSADHDDQQAASHHPDNDDHHSPGTNGVSDGLVDRGAPGHPPGGGDRRPDVRR
jgi:hypothetical protein